MAQHNKVCGFCGELGHSKFYCLKRPNKVPKQKGKRTLELEAWVRTVARPYLIQKYGAVCAECGGIRCGNKQLDVDHILNKGSHYSLRMSLSNVQLLGRYPCHRDKTDRVNIM